MRQRPDLSSSLAIYNFLHPIIGNLDHEQAHLLLMNQNFKLIKNVKISEGGLTETAVDIRRIIREATLNNATIIAFAHNHPSNCPTPSKADDFLTQQIAKACELMRVFFMDHVIIADGTYYSYHDKGKLDNWDREGKILPISKEMFEITCKLRKSFVTFQSIKKIETEWRKRKGKS